MAQDTPGAGAAVGGTTWSFLARWQPGLTACP